MEWSQYENKFKEKADVKINWLEDELIKIRTGRPNPKIFDSLLIDAYDSKMRIYEIANISVVEGKQILIKPFGNDKAILSAISSAIQKSNLGLTPQTDADAIRINFPPQTEEVRKASVKKVKEYIEQAKIAIRNIRKEVHSSYKNDKELTEDDLKWYETQLDKTTKDYNTKIDQIFSKKEKELMTL